MLQNRVSLLVLAAEQRALRNIAMAMAMIRLEVPGTAVPFGASDLISTLVNSEALRDSGRMTQNDSE